MQQLIVEAVEPGSILDEMEVEAGDIIRSINGVLVEDVMDYRYLIADEMLIVEIEKKDGEIWELEIEKDFSEDLGLAFTDSMIETRTCRNHCVFCFIDQMPKGMRPTLYVKDDDERLSFLLGNYITLTNLTDEEIERIIRYRIMPINISIHTTDDALRCKMLNNRFAGGIMESLRHFAENGIEMNGQIVLCPGYNDGKALEKTLKDLVELYPQMRSVSVVPVGLTKYREGLAALSLFDKVGAQKTIEIIENVQVQMKQKNGINFVYASDEFYLKAGYPLPSSKAYDGFPQIENGVGMLRDFKDSLDMALSQNTMNYQKASVGIITGKLAADFMKNCVGKIKMKFPDKRIEIYSVRNDFFGETITVAGLTVGQDIVSQVPKAAVDYYLLPQNMLMNDGTKLLDDMALEELSQKLERPVKSVPVDGAAFLAACFQE